MPSYFYEQGAKAGKQWANKNIAGIKGAPNQEAISILAGRCLEHYRKQAERDAKFYSKQEPFALGFWEAFVTRAEELRS